MRQDPPDNSPGPAFVGAFCSAFVSVKPRGATRLYGVHVAGRRGLNVLR